MTYRMKGLFLLIVAMAALGPASIDAAAPDSTPPSAQFVLAHPEAVSPFDYATAVEWLWSHGRRQQAAFWFYVFQARTRPWALADKGGDGAAALRSALNDDLGTVINGWVASDLVAWRTIAERAVAYEQRLPMGDEHPTGLDVVAWRGLVEQSRADYAAQMESAFAELTPDALAAKRRAAGLAVGPLLDAGPPLPDGWR